MFCYSGPLLYRRRIGDRRSEKARTEELCDLHLSLGRGRRCCSDRPVRREAFPSLRFLEGS